MRVLGVIPARLGSTRLPHKPLQLLAGEPLVTRVAQRVAELGLVDELVVATDSQMVAQVVRSAGVPVVLTGEHVSGTDRVAEVVARPEFGGFDAVVNVQGDEPLLDRAALEGALARVAAGDAIGTAAAPLDPALAADPARVKVVTDAAGRALYFSRAVIPHSRDGSPAELWQHVGVYVYGAGVLGRWVSLAPAPSELAEGLEQLRALHYGLSVGVARLPEPAAPGVDTPEDLRRAEALWLASHR